MFFGFRSLWQAKPSLCQFLQMTLTTVALRFLPFRISRFYLAACGRVYYLLHRPEKSLIKDTISRIFRGQMAAAELQGTIAGVFRGIFDHYHEKLFVGYANFPKLLALLKRQIRFQGRELLQDALAEGRGVILVTGHFGALEFLPGALAVNSFPTAMICRFQTSRLREVLGRRAQWVGVQLIDPDRGNAFLSALRALKAGRVLIIECDEFERWRPDPQRASRFLNYRLTSDRTLELLHQRSGAPVITALVQRDGHRQYTCDLTAVGQAAAPVNLPISEQCLRILETSVQTHPEQWYQWPKFAKMIQTRHEARHDHQEGRDLAPEIGLSLPGQA